MEGSDFELIYKRYVPKVFSFALKLSNDYYVAEEITQETFVRAYISLHSFRGECRLEVWLCQIAKNLFYDYIKNYKNETNASLEMHEVFDYHLNVENKVIASEDVQRLIDVIISLNEPQRSVIIDCLFLELSYKEIAIKYNKTENWARVTFYRAKQKVKKTLNKLEEAL